MGGSAKNLTRPRRGSGTSLGDHIVHIGLLEFLWLTLSISALQNKMSVCLKPTNRCKATTYARASQPGKFTCLYHLGGFYPKTRSQLRALELDLIVRLMHIYLFIHLLNTTQVRVRVRVGPLTRVNWVKR